MSLWTAKLQHSNTPPMPNIYIPADRNRPSGTAAKLLAVVEKHGLEVLA